MLFPPDHERLVLALILSALAFLAGHFLARALSGVLR